MATRALDRRGLSQATHLLLIDNDLDRQEAAIDAATRALDEKLDQIIANNRWILRTIGAGFVSFAVLVGGVVAAHVKF